MPGVLEDLAAALADLRAELAALRENRLPTREVYTLADLAELPEAPCIKTLRNNPGRQPNYGKPDGYVGTRKAWHRETVEAWRRQLSPAPEGRGFAHTKELGGAA